MDQRLTNHPRISIGVASRFVHGNAWVSRTRTLELGRSGRMPMMMVWWPRRRRRWCPSMATMGATHKQVPKRPPQVARFRLGAWSPRRRRRWCWSAAPGEPGRYRVFRQRPDRNRTELADARFLNDAMMATALGDVISDGLDDGRIGSGVGGQYNFIAQGFSLEGARSAIVLHATRTVKGKVHSNIRWSYGHTTIPRHLRDMIVTEYGIADIRGKSDRDVIAAMLAITDFHVFRTNCCVRPRTRARSSVRSSWQSPRVTTHRM